MAFSINTIPNIEDSVFRNLNATVAVEPINLGPGPLEITATSSFEASSATAVAVADGDWVAVFAEASATSTGSSAVAQSFSSSGQYTTEFSGQSSWYDPSSDYFLF